ncbi:universal stress protein [Glaciimonas sp. GG7]
MSYKTILVHVDQSRHAPECIRVAAGIAITQNAHLIGAAMTGISPWVYSSMVADAGGSMATVNLDYLEERAQRGLTEFEAIVQSIGVTSYERRLIDDDAVAGLSLQARYCDLVVIGQTDVHDPSADVMPDFPENIVMNCGRPVLIIPYIGHFDKIGQQVLVAWNGRMEATHALTQAIPLLKRAQNVEIVVFNPDKEFGVHGEQPGADIALYLARHHLTVEVSQQKTVMDVGNALLSHAADVGADLIVMGGYGHSRFREIILGGVTRTILQSMTTPLLMAH